MSLAQSRKNHENKQKYTRMLQILKNRLEKLPSNTPGKGKLRTNIIVTVSRLSKPVSQANKKSIITIRNRFKEMNTVSAKRKSPSPRRPNSSASASAKRKSPSPCSSCNLSRNKLNQLMNMSWRG